MKRVFISGDPMCFGFELFSLGLLVMMTSAGDDTAHSVFLNGVFFLISALVNKFMIGVLVVIV
jgi:hypothetical protein